MTTEIRSIPLDKIRKPVVESLGEGEEIYCKCKSRRFVPGSKSLNPTEMYVTNQRLMMYQPSFFGRGDIEDLHYSDIQNVNMHKGLISSDIIVVPRFTSMKIELHGMSKDEAYAVNRIITSGIRYYSQWRTSHMPQPMHLSSDTGIEKI